MATVVQRVTLADSSNVTSYTTGAFTPAVGDLLVACVVAPSCVAPGSFTTSAGITFTKITSATKASSNDTLYLFVADSLVASAVSQTATFDCTGDPATGAFIDVLSVQGLSRAGASAVVQSGVQNNISSGGTPSITLGAAASSSNPLIGFVGNASSPAGITQPSGWTEQFDGTGFTSPTTGLEVVSIDSGFSGSTITWASTSATSFGAVAVEFNTSAAASTRTGTMAATETGADTLAASGTVAVRGALSASETGTDTATAAGKVAVRGTMATSEGADTFAASAKAPRLGLMAATEIGADRFAASGGAFTDIQKNDLERRWVAGATVRVVTTDALGRVWVPSAPERTFHA